MDKDSENKVEETFSEVESSELCFEGTCFCGAASFKVKGEPLLSAYCHCTVCQRLTGCAFVHGLHYPTQSFTWTHKQVNNNSSSPSSSSSSNPNTTPIIFTTKSPNKFSPWIIWRCQTCYTFIAGHNPTENKWTIKSSHLHRNKKGLIENWNQIKPTAHIFYETRMLDVLDGLPKWDGYEDKSNRLDLG